MADLAQVATLMDEHLREENKHLGDRNEAFAFELGVLREKTRAQAAELAALQHHLHIRELVNNQQAAMIRNNRVNERGWKVECETLKRVLLDIFREYPRLRGEYEEMALQLEEEDELTESEIEELFPDSDMEE